MGPAELGKVQIPSKRRLARSLRPKCEEFLSAQYCFAYPANVDIASHELVLICVRFIARIALTKIKLSISHKSLKSTIDRLRAQTPCHVLIFHADYRPITIVALLDQHRSTTVRANSSRRGSAPHSACARHRIDVMKVTMHLRSRRMLCFSVPPTDSAAIIALDFTLAARTHLAISLGHPGY